MSQDLTQLRACIQKTLPKQQQHLDQILQGLNPTHAEKLSAAFWTEKKWPQGAKITIAFTETGNQVKRTSMSDLQNKNSPWDPLQEHVKNLSVQEAVKEVVRERIQPLVNLQLEFVEDAQANVRVSFDPNGGAWSLVGTDCLHQREGPTMNLGWFDVATTIHEFCHMLGMIHEHQNPKGQGIKWNREAVYNWTRETQGWSKQQANTNILDKYKLDMLNATNFDPLSIMLYFFPGKLTLNDKGTQQNLRLSGMDAQWIAQAYPPKSGETAASFYQSVYNENIEKSIMKSKDEAHAFLTGGKSGGGLDWKKIGVGLAIVLGILFVVFMIWWLVKRRGIGRRGRYRYGRR